MESQSWSEPMKTKSCTSSMIIVFGEVMLPISKYSISQLKNGPTWSEIRFFPKELNGIGQVPA